MTKPIGYLVLAHTDPVHCKRLVSRLLNDEDAQVYVHVDLKSTCDFSAVAALSTTRVHLIKSRVSISWSGFSMVEATIGMMKEALASVREFDYLVLLSGLDYPLTEPQALRTYLHSQPYLQHINRFDVSNSPEHYLKLLSRFQFRDSWFGSSKLDKLARKLATLAARPFKRKLPAGMTCFGSQWWALTDPCARYVCEFWDGDKEYRKFFKYAYAPDEYYFQTIIQNSRFREEASPLLEYKGRGTWRTANLHLIHPSLSKTYTEADFAEVMESDKYFVRKFTTAKSTALLDRMDLAIDAAGRANPDLART
jgi:hypothetical protein